MFRGNFLIIILLCAVCGCSRDLPPVEYIRCVFEQKEDLTILYSRENKSVRIFLEPAALDLARSAVAQQLSSVASDPAMEDVHVWVSISFLPTTHTDSLEKLMIYSNESYINNNFYMIKNRDTLKSKFTHMESTGVYDKKFLLIFEPKCAKEYDFAAEGKMVSLPWKTYSQLPHLTTASSGKK